MPAKDLYHDIVKRALVNDGWTVTHDPLTLRWASKDYFVDLGRRSSWQRRRVGGQELHQPVGG